MDQGAEKVSGKPGKPGSRLLALGCLCLLAAGCAAHRANVEKRLMAQPIPPGEVAAVAAAYRVGCPDVLEVLIAGRPDLSLRVAIGADGRIPLPGDLGEPRIEGRTPAEIAHAVARLADVPPTDVVVRVIEYNARQVYLFGQVKGSQRSLPYRGPETVLDLLQRVGGITPGAEPGDVYVIRAHVADDGRPEVFHVDLQAIVLNKDQTTNVRLQPFDQVHVGETRQARIERCIPPLVRPVYQAIWDTRPTDAGPRGALRQSLADVRRKLAEGQD